MRDRLASAGVITVDRRRLLGVIPIREVTVDQPDEVRLLRDRVRSAVLGGLDPTAVPIEDTALAVIATEGDVGSVFTSRERRTHKSEIKALSAHFDAAFPKLRKAVLTAVVHARSSGSA